MTNQLATTASETSGELVSPLEVRAALPAGLHPVEVVALVEQAAGGAVRVRVTRSLLLVRDLVDVRALCGNLRRIQDELRCTASGLSAVAVDDGPHLDQWSLFVLRAEHADALLVALTGWIERGGDCSSPVPAAIACQGIFTPRATS